MSRKLPVSIFVGDDDEVENECLQPFLFPHQLIFKHEQLPSLTNKTETQPFVSAVFTKYAYCSDDFGTVKTKNLTKDTSKYCTC